MNDRERRVSVVVTGPGRRTGRDLTGQGDPRLVGGSHCVGKARDQCVNVPRHRTLQKKQRARRKGRAISSLPGSGRSCVFTVGETICRARELPAISDQALVLAGDPTKGPLGKTMGKPYQGMRSGSREKGAARHRLDAVDDDGPGHDALHGVDDRRDEDQQEEQQEEGFDEHQVLRVRRDW